MIVDSFYLSNKRGKNKLMEISDLSEDEITLIVGIFRKDHWRFAGKLKGEVVVYADGRIVIRHHFKKTKLWESE